MESKQGDGIALLHHGVSLKMRCCAIEVRKKGHGNLTRLPRKERHWCGTGGAFATCDGTQVKVVRVVVICARHTRNQSTK